MNIVSRKREQLRISEQNNILLSNLNDIKSSYKAKELEREYNKVIVIYIYIYIE